MKSIKLNIHSLRYLTCVAIVLLITSTGYAQLHYNTTASQYFRNRYLLNPAYAGSDSSLRIYGLINRSWIGFDGAPTTFQLSADKPIGNNGGAGLQVATNEAGILRRTQVSLSYSYKIPLTGVAEYFRMGMSVSGYWQQLKQSVVAEEPNDPVIQAFNEKGMRFEGDFGAYYHHRKYFISASMFNLGKWFSDLPDILPVDLETLRLTAGYTFTPDESFTIQPLVAAQFYTKTPWLFRVGAEGTYNDRVFASVFWLNNKTIQAGCGLKISEGCEVNLFYGSSNPQRVGEQLEVGLGLSL